VESGHLLSILITGKHGPDVDGDAIAALVSALAKHPSVKEQHLSFNAAADATFHKVNAGILVWDWNAPSQGRRGKGPLAYYDLDGQIVAVGLLAIDDNVVELELQRGDSTPVLSIPRQSDLWEMQAGVVYSPRG
jgi:hypothetical protein